MYYILKDKKPIEVNISKWVEWQDDFKKKIVKKENINDVEISTVFLGVNHNFGEGEPILFETMIFGGKYDGEQERYCTWDEAIKGHEKIKERILNE